MLYLRATENDPNYHRFSDYVGLNKIARKNPHTARKLIYLFNKFEEKDPYKTIEKFRRVQGVSFRGRELVDFWYQFTKIKTIREAQEKSQAPVRKKAEIKAQMNASEGK